MPNRLCNRLATAAALAAVANYAHASQAPSDPICSELEALVSQTRPGSMHVVKFMIDWAEVSKMCRVEEGDLGNRLCAALNQHGNPEYMAANVIRLVKCLEPTRTFPIPIPDRLPGTEETISVRKGGGTVTVSLKYDTAPADVFPWVVITVRGSGP